MNNLNLRFQQSLMALGIEPGNRVVIGASGGLDSTVLLHLSHEFGLDIQVAHVNYMLRDDESLEDALFVKDLAGKYKVSFHQLLGNELFDGDSGDSIQMQARNIRRYWFEKLLIETNAKAILLGHHADDQVETFFIRMLRSQGILGLASMNEHSGKYLRPMLSFRRQEIVAYALSQGISWREDTSNTSDKYLRNRIRHHLLPAVDLVDSHGLQSMINSVERLNSERSLYLTFLQQLEKTIKKQGNTGFTIEKSPLLSFENVTPLLHFLLRETGFSYALCSQIAQNLTNTCQLSYSNADWNVGIDRSQLFVSHADTNVSEGISIKEHTIVMKEVGNLNDIPLLINKLNAIIDPETLHEPISIRTWRKGDRFWPTGMNGSKLLSDYFTDVKFSEEEKSKQLLVCCGKDIVWVVNQRVDRRFAYKSTSSAAWLIQVLESSI